MNIVTQDRNEVVPCTRADYEPVYSGQLLIAFNVLVEHGNKKYMVGTFDDDIEAIGVVTDINTSIEAGDQWYYVPGFDETMDDEDEEEGE
jgi:hypothetical protein